MIVRFRQPDPTSVPAHEAAFAPPQQVFLTLGRAYQVCALSVFEGLTFLLVIDDDQTPVFLPRALFDVVEMAIPADWVCNIFNSGSIQMVIGPHWLAKSVESYNAMVDQEAGQVERLFQYIAKKTIAT